MATQSQARGGVEQQEDVEEEDVEGEEETEVEVDQHTKRNNQQSPYADQPGDEEPAEDEGRADELEVIRSDSRKEGPASSRNRSKRSAKQSNRAEKPARTMVRTREKIVAQPPDGPRTFRIGRMLNLEEPGQQQDEEHMYAIVVAMYEPSKAVKYSCVYSWEINGRKVGSFSATTDIANIYYAYNAADGDLLKFTPDTLFANADSRRALGPALQGLAAGRRHADLPAIGRPQACPVKGTLQHNINLPNSPHPERGEDSQRPIKVVFEYVNDSLDKDLGLPINNQCSLQEDDQGNFVQDDYASFRTEVLSHQVVEGTWEDYTVDELLNQDQHPRFEYLREIEIWVMPQWTRQELYSWTRQPHLMPSDFIEYAVSDQEDRELYIEVHIKRQDDWVQAQDTYWDTKLDTFIAAQRARMNPWRQLPSYSHRQFRTDIQAAAGGVAQRGRGQTGRAVGARRGVGRITKPGSRKASTAARAAADRGCTSRRNKRGSARNGRPGSGGSGGTSV